MTHQNLYSQLSSLPKELKKQVEDFIEFLILKSRKEKKMKKRISGLAKGLIDLKPDFDSQSVISNEYDQ